MKSLFLLFFAHKKFYPHLIKLRFEPL